MSKTKAVEQQPQPQLGTNGTKNIIPLHPSVRRMVEPGWTAAVSKPGSHGRPGQLYTVTYNNVHQTHQTH